MTQTFLYFPLAVLAVWQAVEVWHHSAIMAGPRARAETWDGFPGDLLGCPFCLSVWLGFLSYLPAPLLGGRWVALPGGQGWLLELPCQLLACFAWGLAVSRAANLCSDASHGVCRTPRHNTFTPPEGPMSETTIDPPKPKPADPPQVDPRIKLMEAVSKLGSFWHATAESTAFAAARATGKDLAEKQSAAAHYVALDDDRQKFCNEVLGLINAYWPRAT